MSKTVTFSDEEFELVTDTLDGCGDDHNIESTERLLERLLSEHGDNPDHNDDPEDISEEVPNKARADIMTMSEVELARAIRKHVNFINMLTGQIASSAISVTFSLMEQEYTRVGVRETITAHIRKEL